MVLILKRFFDQIPVELEDAARVDGANRLRVFWSIVLPLSRPILAAVAIFVFIGAADGEECLWTAICTDNGVRDPRRAAAGGGLPVHPTPDHQGNRHYWFRWAVIPGQMFRLAGFLSPSLEKAVTLSKAAVITTAHEERPVVASVAQ